MNIRLLGKHWKLVRSRLEKDDGYCESPSTPNKRIIVDSRLKDKRELEVLIHEMLHAVDWHKDESSFIEPVAEDIARVLWRLGYRRITQ